MTTETIAAIRALRASIITTATTIRSQRSAAREHFRVARACRKARNEAGAAKATAAGHAARRRADDLGFEARHHQLAYAFLRGRSYAALEGTRKRAVPPRADLLLDVIHDVAPVAGAATLDLIEAWLAAPRDQRITPEPPTRRLGTPPVLAAAEPSYSPTEAR